jgi:hypothetical protein
LVVGLLEEVWPFVGGGSEVDITTFFSSLNWMFSFKLYSWSKTMRKIKKSAIAQDIYLAADPSAWAER